MTVLVTADLHFSANPRDAYRLEFLHKRLPKLIETYKVSEVYMLGDLCESKDEHAAWLVNQVVDGIAKVHYLAPVTVLMGNHDFLQQGEPFFRFLRNIHGLRYISRPVIRKGEMFLPFTRTPEKDWKDLDFKGVRRIFTHMSFKGALGAFGGIDRTLLPDIPIISGDIHPPQKFENVTYVGAPYTIDFGDDYVGSVLILKDGGRSRVTVGGPQKRIISPRLMTDSTSCNRGDIVRVEVPIKAKDYAKWQETSYKISQWATENHVYLDSVIPLITDSTDKPVSKSKRKAPANDEQLLTDYAKTKGIDDRTLETGKKLL
jgi:Calcineurin-like phosphoesterase